MCSTRKLSRPTHYLNRYGTALLCLLLGTTLAHAQQTIQFSQYMFNGLAVNPAYAGYRDEWNAGLSYRMQWTGISGAPKTGTLSLDGLTNSTNKNTGLGLMVITDRVGPQSTLSAYANYAYRLQLNTEDTQRLSFGLALGFMQYNLDGSAFNAVNVSDDNIPAGNENELTPDVRAGIYYYSSTFYAGAAVLNLLSGSKGFTNPYINQVRHVYLTGGVMVPLSEMFSLKPSFLYKEDFRGPSNLDLNSYLLINKRIWLGGSWRTGLPLFNKRRLQHNLDKEDALAAMMQLYITERLRVGYSFDFTLNKLAGYQHGSHELSVNMSLRGKKARILSPRFF